MRDGVALRGIADRAILGAVMVVCDVPAPGLVPASKVGRMPALRRYVNQLGERENIDQVFLVADKQLRANRNGNLYLQLRLTDKTGSLTGMLWNASDNIFNSV